MSLKLLRLLEGSAVTETVAPPALAKVGKFFSKHDWIIGKSADGKWDIQIKAYDEPSYYGINGGQVSKLNVRTVGAPKDVVNYDRGWDVKPSGAALRTLVKDILAAFPKHVDPDDREPENAFEESTGPARLSRILEEAGLANFGGKKAKPFDKEDEAADPVAHWVPVTDKIMKHRYFAVSGKLADAKIACAWRGNGEGYAVVDPSDAAKAKAIVKGIGEAYGEEKDVSKDDLRKIFKGKDLDHVLNNRTGVATDISGKNWEFSKESDLSGEWWNIRKVSESVVLRLSSVLNEEDVTPGIGAKMGRPDLGAYGKDAAKYFNKKKAEGDDAGKGKSAVRGLRAALKAADEQLGTNALKAATPAIGRQMRKAVVGGKKEGVGPMALKATLDKQEDMTPEIGDKMKRPDLGKYGQRRREAKATDDEIYADFKSQYDRSVKQGVAKALAYMSAFNGVATTYGLSNKEIGALLRKNNFKVEETDGSQFKVVAAKKALLTSTSDDVKDKARETLRGLGWSDERIDRLESTFGKEEGRRRPGAALEDAIKQAKDALPRRDAKGRLILTGE